MALTKTAKEQLGASVVGHDDLPTAISLPTGLRKTRRGLIAPVSTTAGDTRSGALVDEEGQQPEEESQYIDDTEPDVVLKEPQRRTRKTKPKKQEQPAFVKLNITIAGFGTIPTQYAHVYTGNGVVILGITDLSFIPQQATAKEGGGLLNVVVFEHLPDRQYVYCGNSFVDSSGTNNIIMIEVKTNG